MSSKHFLRTMFSIILTLFVSVKYANAKDTQYTPIILDASIVILVPFIPNNPNPIEEGRLKKTGQTKSYDKDGILVTNGSIKDDGYYQKGLAHRYSRSGDVVTDYVTGFQWQDDIESGSVVRSWLEAKAYCATLNLNGGGWRLPTVQELQTIIVYNANKQITDAIFVNNNTFPYEQYWSSTTDARFTSNMYAWLVGRGITNKYKTGSGSVRCVR